MAHACNPSYLAGRDQEDQISVQGQLWQMLQETLFQKYPTLKKADRDAQGIKWHLSSKCKVLSSNLSAPKIKN
jgi:hypothetical protein